MTTSSLRSVAHSFLEHLLVQQGSQERVVYYGSREAGDAVGHAADKAVVAGLDDGARQDVEDFEGAVLFGSGPAHEREADAEDPPELDGTLAAAPDGHAGAVLGEEELVELEESLDARGARLVLDALGEIEALGRDVAGVLGLRRVAGDDRHDEWARHLEVEPVSAFDHGVALREGHDPLDVLRASPGVREAAW